MTAPPVTAAATATARCDAFGLVESADAAFAQLQRDCGGEVPGRLALAQLLEMVVGQGGVHGTPTRPFAADLGQRRVSGWAELRADRGGWLVSLSDLATSAIGQGPAGAGTEAVDILLAGLRAAIGGDGRVIAVACSDEALAPVARQLEMADDRTWQDAIRAAMEDGAEADREAALADGAIVTFAGITGQWRIRLRSGSAPRPDERVMQLLLVRSDATIAAAAPADESGEAMFGRDLATALREPIARVIARSDTIGQRLAGPIADAYAGHALEISGAGRHLMGLLDDLAAFEQVRAGSVVVEREPVDLVALARECAAILAPRARERSTALSVEIPGGETAIVADADRRRGLQVLLNLVGNAVRYGDAGTNVRLVVTATAGQVSVTVEDEGPGLSQAEQARIFGKFERLGRSGDGGSGLGLYISRGLAEAMGGTLGVESAPGKGSRFTLALMPATS